MYPICYNLFFINLFINPYSFCDICIYNYWFWLHTWLVNNSPIIPINSIAHNSETKRDNWINETEKIEINWEKYDGRNFFFSSFRFFFSSHLMKNNCEKDILNNFFRTNCIKFDAEYWHKNIFDSWKCWCQVWS